MHATWQNMHSGSWVLDFTYMYNCTTAVKGFKNNCIIIIIIILSVLWKWVYRWPTQTTRQVCRCSCRLELWMGHCLDGQLEDGQADTVACYNYYYYYYYSSLTSCGAKAQQTPSPCCALTKNVIRSSHGHSTPSLKISCKLVQRFARNVADKEISVAASHGFSKMTKKWITSSHGHSTPSLKISCKSVQLFFHNLANKERNKEIDRKQYPVPRCIGDRVIIIVVPPSHVVWQRHYVYCLSMSASIRPFIVHPIHYRHTLYCAEVLLRNCLLTHLLTHWLSTLIYIR